MLRRIKRTWSWNPVEIAAAPKSVGSHFSAKPLFMRCYKCHPELAKNSSKLSALYLIGTGGIFPTTVWPETLMLIIWQTENFPADYMYRRFGLRWLLHFFLILSFDVREGEGLNCAPAHLLTPEVGVCPLYKYFEERVVHALRTETVW